MHLAKRLLKFFPLLLNDIYLSEEYYGENVLHMAAVAEDPSIVKWLLDIGSDFHRRCYGNFFTCDDQKGSRRDNKSYEVKSFNSSITGSLIFIVRSLIFAS